MTTKRTEGEWQVVGGGANGCDVTGFGGCKVAECGKPGRERWPATAEEIEANAQLIAASPQMLDALKLALRRLAVKERQRDALLALAIRVAEHFDGTDAPLGIAARSAIRAATGEE